MPELRKVTVAIKGPVEVPKLRCALVLFRNETGQLCVRDGAGRVHQLKSIEAVQLFPGALSKLLLKERGLSLPPQSRS